MEEFSGQINSNFELLVPSDMCVNVDEMRKIKKSAELCFVHYQALGFLCDGLGVFW